MSKSILSKVAAVACSVVSVVALSVCASAETKKIDPTASELKTDAVNIIATKVQIPEEDLKAANYKVTYETEISNNLGFGPSGVRLVYPSSPKITVLDNEDGYPATEGDVIAKLATEITQNAEKYNVAVGAMGTKVTKTNGTYFTVDFQLPSTAKAGDKFEMKIEVDKFLDGDNVEVPYNVINGYIEITGSVTTTAPVTTTPAPVTTTTPAPVTTTTVVTTTTAPPVVTTAPPVATTTIEATTTSGSETKAATTTTASGTKATTKAGATKTGDAGTGVAVAALLLAAGTAVVAAKKKED